MGKYAFHSSRTLNVAPRSIGKVAKGLGRGVYYSQGQRQAPSRYVELLGNSLNDGTTATIERTTGRMFIDNKNQPN